MNQITDLPSGTPQFGYDFNYELWTAETEIDLTNVPWANDYRDTYRPASQADLDDYIDARQTTNVKIINSSYASIHEPIRINVPLNVAQQYNYVRVNNPVQPIPGDDIQRNYYYFILGVSHVAPNTTELVVELDVWSTFIYECRIGMAYVERSHLPVAAENRFDNNGKDYLTVQEGLDIGSMMRSVDNYRVNLYNYNVVIASTISLTADPGTVNNPRQETSRGGVVQRIALPVEVYVFTNPNDVPSYFGIMSQYGWIARGIYKATIVPNLESFKDGASEPTESLTNVPRRAVTGNSAYPPFGLKYPLRRSAPRRITAYDNFRAVLRSKLPARFRHLDKFLTDPYSAVELTDWLGEPVNYRPEQVHGDALIMRMLMSTIPGSERLVTSIEGYAWDGSGWRLQDSEEFTSSLVSSNFPTIPVVNDGANIALASTAAGRAASRQAADWSYQRTLAGNQNAYHNAGIGIDLTGELAGIGRTQDAGQTALGIETRNRQHLWGSIGNTASGAALGMIGGPGGAVAGAAGGATSAIMGGISNQIQADHDNASLAMRNAASVQVQGANTRASQQIRGNNKRLADFAARGDYQSTIAALNAQVQDMQMSPPQVNGAIGGEMLNIINQTDLFNITARLKLIDIGEINRIGNFWLRYGYALHRFVTPPTDFHCMTKFTYWKMSETYLVDAKIPEMYKQAIRGIFEKGVTVWKDANDMGSIDMSTNEPLTGIRIEAQ